VLHLAANILALFTEVSVALLLFTQTF